MTTSDNRAEKAQTNAVGLCIFQDFPFEVWNTLQIHHMTPEVSNKIKKYKS